MSFPAGIEPDCVVNIQQNAGRSQNIDPLEKRKKPMRLFRRTTVKFDGRKNESMWSLQGKSFNFKLNLAR